MRYSIVIPALEAAATLPRCLQAVRALDHGEDVDQVIVVDDGSRDDTGEIARRLGLEVLRNDVPLGPASARNRGAARASAEILLFVDSNVALPPHTLSVLTRYFEGDPGVDAVVASRSARSHDRNLASRYKNYWTAFNWSHGKRLRTLNASTLAIRRQAFVELGGFDAGIREAFYEDDDLGHRMAARGMGIVVAGEIPVVSMKRFSLLSLVRRDVNSRFAAYMAERGRLGSSFARLEYSSVHPRLLSSFPLIATAALAAGATLLAAGPSAAIGLAAAAIAGIVAFNAPFFSYIARGEGNRIGWIPFVPLFLVHVACAGFAQTVGFVRGLSRRAAGAVRPRAGGGTRRPSGGRDPL